MSSKLEYLGAPVGQNIRLYKYGNMSICDSRSKEAGTPGVDMKADEHMLIVSFAAAPGRPYEDALIDRLLPQLGMKAGREIRLFPNLTGASSSHSQTRYYIQVQADTDAENGVIDA